MTQEEIPDLLNDDDIELQFVKPLESYTYRDCTCFLAHFLLQWKQEKPDEYETSPVAALYEQMFIESEMR